jgi:4-hydroxybenzoate polyprenyltransferase
MSAPSHAVDSAPRLAAALFDLSRGRQALLSIAQPGLAAVLAAGGLPSRSIIVIGLIAAAAGFLAVFSLNDVLDRRVDAAAVRVGKGTLSRFDLDAAFLRHPLAQGQLSLKTSLLWIGGLTVVAMVGALLLYCALRSVTWAKTVVSGLMVGVGGLAGWVAVSPLDREALPVFLFLALWEIGGRNLANDLADLGPDAAVGLRTVATTFGARTAAQANLAVAMATLVAVLALQLDAVALAASLLAGVWLVALPALRLWREPTSERAGWYFNRASLYPVAVLLSVCASCLVLGRP